MVWACSGRTPGVLWACCGRAVVVPWASSEACSGRALCVLWPCCGRALGVLWECSGRALGVLWACSGRARDVLWACSGRALGVIWAGSGRALGVAGRALGMICSGVPLTFLWHVTNTAWQPSREASSNSKETRWTADAQKLYRKHRAPTISNHQAWTSLRESSMLSLRPLAGISRGTPGGTAGSTQEGHLGLGGYPGVYPGNKP